MTLQLNQPLQRTLVGQKSWWVLDDGLEIVAFDYQTPSWNRPRRVVDIRQKIDESPDAKGKQLSLFVNDLVLTGLPP